MLEEADHLTNGLSSSARSEAREAAGGGRAGEPASKEVQADLQTPWRPAD